MDLTDAVGFIDYLIIKKNESILFQRWINGYQTMSFDEFKQSLTPARNRSDEEILAEVYANYEKATNK